jgi:hypothetical protein
LDTQFLEKFNPVFAGETVVDDENTDAPKMGCGWTMFFSPKKASSAPPM